MNTGHFGSIIASPRRNHQKMGQHFNRDTFARFNPHGISSTSLERATCINESETTSPYRIDSMNLTSNDLQSMQ